MPRTGILLCYPFEEKRFNKWNTTVIVQPKLDGVRCRALLRGNEEPLLLSSEENILNFSIPHIVEELDRLQSYFIREGIFELDGEVYSHALSFDEIVSRTSRTVNRHEDYLSVQYHVFDHVCSETPFADRIKAVQSTYFASELLHNYVKLVPLRIASTLNDITYILEEYYNLGYEGIVARHPGAPYRRSRSPYVMKWKPRKSDIYTIIGFEEECSIHGEPKGSLGALILQDEEKHTFSAGSGFKREERKELWKYRNELPGLLCEIKYQHTTSTGVPRFPVFSFILSPPLNEEPNER